ncbi:hypothetical protein CHUAL_007415 [Chamberlinius hualienensis]
MTVAIVKQSGTTGPSLNSVTTELSMSSTARTVANVLSSKVTQVESNDVMSGGDLYEMPPPSSNLSYFAGKIHLDQVVEENVGRSSFNWSSVASVSTMKSSTVVEESLHWWDNYNNDSSDWLQPLLPSASTVQSYVVNETWGNLVPGMWNGNDSVFTVENDTVTNNVTEFMGPDPVDSIVMAVTAVVLGLLILITVIGNVFVIAAILLERNLQNVANFLILSLAVADLMVACLVMPLGAVYVVSTEWILGPGLCDMWTSSDVLCCTASILHLVAIAVDRFWAVTNVDYIHQRNSKRIGIMILIIWVVAVVVSLLPVIGWKDAGFHERIDQKVCIVSQDIAYQLFATMATFYLPLIVILFLYYRIFQAARKRIRRKVDKNAQKAISKANNRPSEVSSVTTTTAFTMMASSTANTISVVSNVSPEKSSSANGSTSQTSHMSDMSRMEMLPKNRDRKIKESPESKREKKAAKTLAIITGAFVVCWMPFFVIALIMPLCGDSHFNKHMINFFLWLGYFNSTLNPIIYTIFSPEFRNAFRRILFGRQARYRPKR